MNSISPPQIWLHHEAKNEGRERFCNLLYSFFTEPLSVGLSSSRSFLSSLIDESSQVSTLQQNNQLIHFSSATGNKPFLDTVRNLHFLSKNSTLISRENCRVFFGEKLVKMLWFGTFYLLTTLISGEKLSKKFWVKNSWNCCGFGLFSCWQLWFHEKNCQKILVEKLVKMLWFWTF